MDAIRKIVKVKDNKIIIDLGNKLESRTEYEVIILPIEDNRKQLSRKDFCGRWKGMIEMSNDFDEPLEDFEKYME